jgi:hypothetical protein
MDEFAALLDSVHRPRVARSLRGGRRQRRFFSPFHVKATENGLPYLYSNRDSRRQLMTAGVWGFVTRDQWCTEKGSWEDDAQVPLVNVGLAVFCSLKLKGEDP